MEKPNNSKSHFGLLPDQFPEVADSTHVLDKFKARLTRVNAFFCFSKFACASHVSKNALSLHVFDEKFVIELNLLYGLNSLNGQQPCNAGSQNFKEKVELGDVYLAIDAHFS